MTGSEIEVFTTCPQSSALPSDEFVRHVSEVARWSDSYQYKGILVYTDNSLVDPWLVSQIIVQNTRQLCPLIAVQPAYMHPYSVAKMVSSFGHLYRRRVYLNMVAGGFKTDLAALNDTTPHDKRYARLIEYTSIIKELLQSPAGVTYHGEFYFVDKLRMTPTLAPELFPGIFVSGSSEAGLAAARCVGATAVKYPQPAESEPVQNDDGLHCGVRVGIIARKLESGAWEVAHSRFPEDRKGQLTHQLAMKVSDSKWHSQLSHMTTQTKKENGPYWLVPFENYKTFCPYLVGSYDRVAVELAKYIARGYRTFILDIPASQEELEHVTVVFKRAKRIAAR